MSAQSSTPPRPGRTPARARLRATLATLAGGALLATLTPAAAQPVNPGDDEIAAAETAVGNGEQTVSELVGSITDTQADIDRLELEVSGLHEAVNKALVDLHDARAAAEQARQGVVAAKEELDDTQRRLEEAQSALDEISRTAYRRTATPNAVSDAAGTSTTEDALDRQTYLRTTADKQRETIEELDRLRAENANRESQLREARNLAEEREARAVEAEAEARAAIEDNSRQIAERSAERDRLVARRDQAQTDLDAAREHVATLNEQRQDYQDYREAEKEAAAAAEAEKARQQEEADQRARDEEAATATRGAAAETAVSAAAGIIAASQPDHSNLDSPYPAVSDEGAAGGDIAAVQHAAATTAGAGAGDTTGQGSSSGSSRAEDDGESDGGVEVTTTPAIDTLSSVTDRASEAVSGTREELIEIAIARAESQMGVPYAWGGGNAVGPTQGIRDGGVGDAHGDFRKTGFDCSGLVVYAFAGAGIALPHYSGYQYHRGEKIDPGQMQRGDLIFYGPEGSTHVAIYLGDGMMIEAPNSGSVVKKSPVRWTGMSDHAVRLI
ncbi:DIP1281 family NlpC/P60 protein [Corynebacterium halotolerans]|uniref:Rpf-interacting protein n=1 Tax=Corynebacterium halotolerans YIM 70093 = DSM 44683 TaxID=1121362 RepID=M1NMD1_9CORY|nr:NlpC/P60 family protein [Corynebacterium halotolerans]AGF72503.1 Rpf-interacting protein [Corynebacterium halotolerans YIM 70093 = DSM 44683]